MPVESLSSLMPASLASPLPSAAASAGAADTSAFLEALRRTPAEPSSEQDAAREAAEQLVASSLIMPLLKEVREQPLDAGLFHGGPAEDAFGQQLDQHFADRIVRSANFPLVDRIYQDITRSAARAAAPEIDTHG